MTPKTLIFSSKRKRQQPIIFSYRALYVGHFHIAFKCLLLSYKSLSHFTKEETNQCSQRLHRELQGFNLGSITKLYPLYWAYPSLKIWHNSHLQVGLWPKLGISHRPLLASYQLSEDYLHIPPDASPSCLLVGGAILRLEPARSEFG